MTPLQAKIGQRIMIGLKGDALTREEERLLRDYPFGGFILFSHNLKEPEQILSLCLSLWKTTSDLPPFIAVDQEGGRVHGLPPPFTHFPPPALLGRTGDSSLVYHVGLATARELRAVGINLNFAPVLDVLSNPNNPVIGDRSLGSEPGEVAMLGWSIAQGLRDGGVIPCGKHFPGHGDTSQDSHLELPVVRKSRVAMKAVELSPFIHACRRRIESLMTAHVLYPSWDPAYPATLSRTIIGRLLRSELGYRGVVFADDLEMGAISGNYPLEEVVAFSTGAGVDVFLFCHRTDEAMRAFDFLHRLGTKDSEIAARVEEGYRRIRRLKQRHLRSSSGMGEDALSKHIGITSHQRLAEEILKAAEHHG